MMLKLARPTKIWAMIRMDLVNGGLTLRHPIDAARAKLDSIRATDEAVARYGVGNPTLTNGEGDAWRDARWKSA